MITFQEENNLLLKTILEERFFKPWSLPKDTKNLTLQSEASLELFLTNACDQHCSYCYLVKYPDLYPVEARNPEQIKKNLKIIYKWILKNNYYIPQLDFFTGEIWATQFGLDVLQITLDALIAGMQVPYMVIPSNCSFCLNPKQTARIQHYIDEFKKYGTTLQFSISVDGKVIDNESRPFNNEALAKSDEYYENIFLFAQHNNFYFHPMVAASSVSKWIENYKWWKTEFKKYNMNIYNLMMLEVRNNDWTEQAVSDYNNFMKYLIDQGLEESHNNIELFTKKLFNIVENPEESNYIPYSPSEIITFAPCTIPSQLTIRVGDLAIPPCHRTAYNKLLYGKFITENDEIVSIEANNIYTAQKILLGNTLTTHFKCDACVIKPYCLKGCFGEQWEDNADPFMPSTNVCWFFEKKWTFLVSYFYDIGIVKYCKENFNPFHIHYPRIKQFIDFCEGVNQQYELGKS